ncbi:MAG: DUF2784 domain-containing protein [Gemmatimonadota bacterium]|nr:DUF2784 domain-containing protein [Gemmatimonadota bacterium]
MSHAFLADMVLVGHLAFVLFVIFGGLLALRWSWVSVPHLPVLAWGVWIELTGGVCPLTPVENRLRRAAGQAGYEATFIEHYIVPIVYPPGLTHGIQVGLGVALVLGNAAVYVGVWRRWRRSSSC